MARIDLRAFYLFATLLLIANAVGYSYDNQVTHPDVITRKAIGDKNVLTTNSYPPSNTKKNLNPEVGLLSEQGYDFPEVSNYFRFRVDNQDSPFSIRNGTIHEDDGTNPIHHFYNPFTKDGLFGFKDAYDYSLPIWNGAIHEYAQGNKITAYYDLGIAIHLLEDMGSAPHTQSDIHFTLGGLLPLGENDYEHCPVQTVPLFKVQR